jgi:hypothetical protein
LKCDWYIETYNIRVPLLIARRFVDITFAHRFKYTDLAREFRHVADEFIAWMDAAGCILMPETIPYNIPARF